MRDLKVKLKRAMIYNLRNNDTEEDLNVLKIEKWSKIHSINRGMDKKDVVYIHNKILLNHKKEQNWSICRDLDGHRTWWVIVIIGTDFFYFWFYH